MLHVISGPGRVSIDRATLERAQIGLVYRDRMEMFLFRVYLRRMLMILGIFRRTAADPTRARAVVYTRRAVIYDR